MTTPPLTRRQFLALAAVAAAGIAARPKGRTMPDRFAGDPHRPRYHFMPPANWMNDPNGPILWRGEHHLFYQHNPGGAYWGDMHWGHAVSRDLVNWTHLPMALAPTPGGPDKDGVFSGCAVDNGGVPTLIFTGVNPQVQCVATSRDNLLTWTKDPHNPVIVGPPPGITSGDLRDPCVWREKDGWYLIIGSAAKEGGAGLLYRSPNLVKWEYLHPLCVGNRAETGDIWECPDFFALGDKHVLLCSPIPGGRTRWLVGEYRDHRFYPEKVGTVDFGGHYYAAKSEANNPSRRILWGWSSEGRSDASQRAFGWAGCMALPRVLTLRSDGTLGMEPAEELHSLRSAHKRLGARSLQGEETLPEISGDSLELALEIEPNGAGEVGLAVRRSPDGAEQTRIAYRPADRRLVVDIRKASLGPDTERAECAGTLELASNEPLKLRVFIDRSIVEVYANGRACATARVYPTRSDSVGVAAFATGGEARLKSLDAWTMKSAQFTMSDGV